MTSTVTDPNARDSTFNVRVIVSITPLRSYDQLRETIEFEAELNRDRESGTAIFHGRAGLSDRVFLWQVDIS